MNFYQSTEHISHDLVWAVSNWLVKKLKIVENLSGLYGSAQLNILD